MRRAGLQSQHGALAWQAATEPEATTDPLAHSSTADSRALSRDPLMAFLLNSWGAAAVAGEASTVPPSSSAASEPRSAGSGGVDVRPWLLRFSDLRFVRPIGEGSFGKASAAAGVVGLRWGCCCGGHAAPLHPGFTAQEAPIGSTMHPITAQVYFASWHETPVAVKILLGGGGGSITSGAEAAQALQLSKGVAAKLEGEAGLMAALRHPNIVSFRERAGRCEWMVGREGAGQPWLAAGA